MITSIAEIDSEITEIMNRYIEIFEYDGKISFSSKAMISDKSIIYSMNIKNVPYEKEYFKIVFPIEFLQSCEKSIAIKMIVDLFKNVLCSVRLDNRYLKVIKDDKGDNHASRK